MARNWINGESLLLKSKESGSVNELQKVFKYSDIEVRTLVKDGEPWFVAKDVCDILDIQNSRQALERISDKNKGVSKTDTLGGKQEVAIINEPGLYKLIFTSNKEEAEQFQDWVYEEVLPSIRETGQYKNNSTTLKNNIDSYHILAEGLPKAKRIELHRMALLKTQLQTGDDYSGELALLGYVPITTEILPNSITRFVEENCRMHHRASVGMIELYIAYDEWCKENDELTESWEKLNNMITKINPTIRKCKTSIQRFWYGITLTI